MSQQWNSTLYDTQHSFVANYGLELLKLLKPQEGEAILDLGCGTGTLAHRIAESGAKVIGIDSSASMVNQAKINFPNIEFIVKDGHHFTFNHQFDAVFSNAALHWMTKPDQVIEKIYTCLKPGGRFIFEMGGNLNVAKILNSITIAAKKFGLHHVDIVNYYPKLGTYCNLLEEAGFKVDYAETVDRPTQLVGKEGIRNWIIMFRNNILQQISQSEQEAFFNMVEEIAKPSLYKNDIWWADYVRLRAQARKPL